MILFIFVKSIRPDHSKISKYVQAYANIAGPIKRNEFHRRSKYMQSTNPVFKFTSVILDMFKCRSRAYKETISSCLAGRVSNDVLPIIGGQYRFCKKMYIIRFFIYYTSFNTNF